MKAAKVTLIAQLKGGLKRNLFLGTLFIEALPEFLGLDNLNA